MSHWEKEVKNEKHHSVSILERKVIPCGFELTKSGIEFWCSSGTWSHGLQPPSILIYNLQISEDPYNIFYQTVKCVKFEYFIANILEVSASLLLWLLNILDKLPYSSVGQLLDWNPGHSLCNYLFYEILYKALLSASLSSHLKDKMDQMIYIHLLFQLKSLTIPENSSLYHISSQIFFWRWLIYILFIPEK